MSRMMWIIVLVAAGVVVSVALGLIGSHGSDSSHSEAKQQSTFCSDVSSLESSVESLLALDPSSASQGDYHNALDQVDSDWDAVKSSFTDLKGDTQQQLEDAWNDFESSVSSVSSDDTVSDALNTISSSAQALASDAKTALSGPNCSSS